MDKNTFIEKIKTSAISEERKQKILELLEHNDFDFDTKQTIKDIIQEDIDSTVVELNAEDLQELKEAEDQLVLDIEKIEGELKEDLAFVETEMNDLENMVKDIDEVTNQVEIDALTASIKSSE